MSKHRQEMVSIWGDSGGFNITRGHHRGFGAVSFSLAFCDLSSLRLTLMTTGTYVSVMRNLCKISLVGSEWSEEAFRGGVIVSHTTRHDLNGIELLLPIEC